MRDYCSGVLTSTRALKRNEGVAYVRHRLARASQASARIFDHPAIERVVDCARGNPRTINMLCDNALIAGYGYMQKPITLAIVDEVIGDFMGTQPPGLVRKLGAMITASSIHRTDAA